MNLFPTCVPFNMSLRIAAAVLAAGAFGLGTARAQLLAVPSGSTLESSQNNGTRPATNLFDGTPVFGSSANLGGFFTPYNNANTTPAGGTNNDYEPIVAFDQGSAVSVTGIGYAQLTGIGGTYDLVGTINIFTLTLAQFNAYKTALLTPETTVGQGGLVAAPAAGAYLAEASVTISNLANSNFTQSNLTGSLNGEYFVAQFVNSNASAGTNAGNFPGGEEFRLVGVPEPATFSLLGVGLVSLGVFARRRLTA